MRLLKILLPIVAFLLMGSLIPPAEAQETAFTVEYPLEVRPAKIVRKFVAPKPGKTPYEGIDFSAWDGAAVRAGAAGKVTKVVTAENGKGWGAYVTIKTIYNGVKHRVTYGNLRNIEVTVGQEVLLRQRIARVSGGSLKLIIQASQGGMSGFKVRNVVHPKNFLKLAGMKLRPIDNGLRVRKEPNTEGDIVAQVNQWDFLDTSESAYGAMLRAGKNKWLRVRTASGVIGYASGLYLKVVSSNDSKSGIPGIPIKGVNLDRYNPLGTPPSEPLQNMGWVRIAYDLSYNPDTGTYGNTDIWATYNRYYPIIRNYANSGVKVILVFTHELYGEGQNYVWEQMSPQQWQELAVRYADYARQVAAQYAAEKLVYAYQIWNEQDTIPGSGSLAAVPMPYNEYANLLTQTIRGIRLADTRVKIITGGHVTGNVLGANYARATLALLPPDVRPDGIAFHPYGLGPIGSPFNVFGTIDDAVKAWSSVMPNTPMWITEWGILDKQNDPSLTPAIALHAEGFIQTLEQKFPGMLAAAVWYAWADGMDNGYGLVDMNAQPKEPLYSSYLGIAGRFALRDEYTTNPLIPLPK
jgi:hypothetical protein